MMKRILLEEDAIYPCLFKGAVTALTEARAKAREAGLCESSWISGKENITLYPWLGSRGMRTLLLVLQAPRFRKLLGIRSLSRENDFVLQIETSLPHHLFREEFKNTIFSLKNIEGLIDPLEIPYSGKFDLLLPLPLLLKQYAANMLDLGELQKTIRKL
jgi:hypothetical protein